MAIETTMVFFPVSAHIVLVTDESIPPDIPMTREAGSLGIDLQ